jgi:ectoine hydrolase
LPQAELHRCHGLVNWQRAVKSPGRDRVHAPAAKIVERCMHRILEVAEPGLPKNRLVAELYKVSDRRRRGALGRLSGHRADDCRRAWTRPRRT